MLAQLRRLYYWPGMRKDIDAWCRQCEGCAVSRGPSSRPHGHLRKVSAGAPMDLVAIDILSGLPATADGYKYLLVAIDYFTKWLEAIPLCDAEAQTCMRALYSAFFSRFGLPRQLHSDQESNFESKLVAELCSIAGINKTRTTPFHPRSDGQTESANRTILRMLLASIDAQPESWPDRLPALLAAYRMTPHSVTGISPNMAMMGREVLLPPSLIVQTPEESVAVTTSFAAQFRQNMRNAHAAIRSATSRAAKTQNNYFDKHVKGPPFALNQLVWLYWSRPLLRSRSRKLTRSWTGHWCIVEFKTTIVVVLQNVKTHKKQTVHVDRLVPCRSRLHDEAEETVVPPPTRPRRSFRRPARLQDLT